MEAFAAILEAEEKITKQILEIEDSRIDLLKTIPAIGDLSSRVILSAIDDVKRFGNKKKAANYAALTPTIYQSGGVLHQGHINVIFS